MTMSNIKARNAFGTTVEYVASTIYGNRVGIAGVINIVPPKFSKNVIDVTNHGTTDGYQQVIPGTLTRSSPITMTAVYITSSSMMPVTICTAFDNRTLGSLVITIAGTSSMNQIVSEGYITDYNITTPFDDKVTFEMSFKSVGQPLIRDQLISATST
jgi:predicted secreted protein